jgi:hypothetical protein
MSDTLLPVLLQFFVALLMAAYHVAEAAAVQAVEMTKGRSKADNHLVVIFISNSGMMNSTGYWPDSLGECRHDGNIVTRWQALWVSIDGTSTAQSDPGCRREMPTHTRRVGHC